MFPGTINWGAVVAGILASIVTGSFGVLLWILKRPKFIAEVERLESETRGLDSSQLIQELDRLAASNKTMGREIEGLRADVMRYASRELEHRMEIQTLRLRISELERPQSPLGSALQAAFEIDVPHISGEFDDPATDPPQPV